MAALMTCPPTISTQPLYSTSTSSSMSSQPHAFSSSLSRGPQYSHSSYFLPLVTVSTPVMARSSWRLSCAIWWPPSSSRARRSWPLMTPGKSANSRSCLRLRSLRSNQNSASEALAADISGKASQGSTRSSPARSSSCTSISLLPVCWSVIQARRVRFTTFGPLRIPVPTLQASSITSRACAL